MNTYTKFCPNVFVAKCTERHEKGETIEVQTKYGKENEHIVFNLVAEKNGFFFYSIVRADGFNHQEWIRRKAERIQDRADRASAKADHYYERSNKDSEFLSLGETIKVGHHSERGHRKMIEDCQRNTRKFVENFDKAQELSSRADRILAHENDINLSMPESLEYFKEKLEQAKEYHAGVKSGKYPRTHSFTLTYAKKAVNDLEDKVRTAERLWGDTNQ